MHAPDTFFCFSPVLKIVSTSLWQVWGGVQTPCPLSSLAQSRGSGPEALAREAGELWVQGRYSSSSHEVWEPITFPALWVLALAASEALQV